MNGDADLDLGIAFATMHRWALENGDLGYEYWYRVAALLKAAAAMKARVEELEAQVAALRQRSAGCD